MRRPVPLPNLPAANGQHRPLRIGIFADGHYLYRSFRDCCAGKDFDYRHLRTMLELALGGRVTVAYYFDAQGRGKSDAKRQFFDWLSMSYEHSGGGGFRTKIYWTEERQHFWDAAKREPILHPASGEPYSTETQKAVDVGLIFHMMNEVYNRSFDVLVLGAGDADFHEPIQHLSEGGLPIVLLGDPGNIAPRLHSYARGILSFRDPVIVDAICKGNRPPDAGSVPQSEFARLLRVGLDLPSATSGGDMAHRPQMAPTIEGEGTTGQFRPPQARHPVEAAPTVAPPAAPQNRDDDEPARRRRPLTPTGVERF